MKPPFTNLHTITLVALFPQMTKPMATFCCAIETEPKTLNEVQLNHAREVAVGIFKDKEPSEASRIFSEGMKPVIGVEEMAMAVQRKDLVHKLQDTSTCTTSDTNEPPCQCSIGADSTPEQTNVKEPLTAPF